MSRRNGSQIGLRKLISAGRASGIWSLNEQVIARRKLIWPASDNTLDAFPFSAGYSLRNLTGAFNNDVILVRRSSDNAELGFKSSQILDGTLTSWVGVGNDGFVKTWYDQSGNGRHATQSLTTEQPWIVIGGNLILNNNLPVIYLNNRKGLSTTYTIGTTWSVFLVGQNSKNGYTRMLNASQNNALMSFNRFANGFYHGGNTIFDTTIYPGTSFAIGTYIKSPSSARGYVNGVDRTSDSNGSNSDWPNFSIGSAGVYDTETPIAKYYEVIVYNQNKTNDRTNIESIINSYYGIY